METSEHANDLNGPGAAKPGAYTNTRDGVNRSIWQDGLRQHTEEKQKGFNADKTYDALIVGAGITGMTAAMRLQKLGQACVLVDAHNVGFGTTGGTTAHINTIADTSYDEAEKKFGKEYTRLFAKAIAEGFETIRKYVSVYSIDCEFEMKTGYLYAENEKQARELEHIHESAVKNGVSVKIVASAPTPVPHIKALVLEDQAQFHPLKYLQTLKHEFIALGGVLLENTRIEEVETHEFYHAGISGPTKIKAKNIIYATHIPIGGVNVLHFLAAPYRSYVIAARLKTGEYPKDLIYDMQDPYHYLRTHRIDGQDYLIVGGNDHKTAHEDPDQAFADLESYVRRYYDVESIAYKWSAQYYSSADGLPYVGQLPGAPEGIYAATGYNGNGMMLGSVSGKVLADLVLGKDNPYADLFDTKRIKPLASAAAVLKENTDVAYHFFADRFSVDELKTIDELLPGQGAVKEFSGRKVALYKDWQGQVTALSPECSHVKCIVNWNNAEKSWDCPCHGGRFDVYGNVLTGPPRKNLTVVELPSVVKHSD